MNDRQWVATTAFGGVIASSFLYLPWIGGLTALLVASAIQGGYLGWQRVPTPQFRLGMLAFAAGTFVGMPVMGIVLSRTGPGNLWGIAAMFGIASGLVVMLVVRLYRNRQSS